MILADIKGFKYLHRLQRLLFQCNLRSLLISIQSIFNQSISNQSILVKMSLRISCKRTKIQTQIMKLKIGLLTMQLMKFFRLLPKELCPKTQQEHSPAKPLSGIEQSMESGYSPLLVLSQSKLVENTTKYIQNRLDTEKCCRDWICPQNLVSALAPMKFYKSQNQFLPTNNVPPLEADSSLLDQSNKGRDSVPIKNLEAWEKKARKLIAINSHADLFSSAAFLCLQQQSMSVTALSRLLEAIVDNSYD